MKVELSGMLPATIRKVEELLCAVSYLNPQIVRGYDYTAGKDSFFGWGVACQITCDNMAALEASAKTMGFIVLSDGLAYTNGLTIDDFKTYRVNGELELTPERNV